MAAGAAPAPLLLLLLAQLPAGPHGNRHAVYWNSSNQHLRRDGYTVQVNVNDYLDIYCPHYNGSGSGPGPGGGGAEQYVLYMVSRAGYRTCNASQGFKRWECNRPHAPHSPIKFSEKFQRYSAFSLGYEFHAGHEYYYICESPAGGRGGEAGRGRGERAGPHPPRARSPSGGVAGTAVGDVGRGRVPSSPRAASTEEGRGGHGATGRFVLSVVFIVNNDMVLVTRLLCAEHCSERRGAGGGSRIIGRSHAGMKTGSQMRPREVKRLARSHPADRWRSRDRNPRPPTPKPGLFPLSHAASPLHSIVFLERLLCAEHCTKRLEWTIRQQMETIPAQ
uniref:Ephrin-A3 n=1 Tax=Ornithorhynchus anatinus TaxID=9258 RepID=A0A6I8P9X8_ORNAN